MFWVHPIQVDQAADYFSARIPGVKNALVKSQLKCAGQISLGLAKTSAADAWLVSFFMMHVSKHVEHGVRQPWALLVNYASDIFALM